MKICQDHWGKVREAIKARGLDHLGAKDGATAAAEMIAQANGEETRYDPLMNVHWMITNEAIRQGGLYLLTQAADGVDRCPICEAVKAGAGDEKWWIDGPADAALKHARELGLVAPVQ